MTTARFGRRFLVITPAKDEAQFLPRTIATVVGQTLRPTRWVIVDDGSTDETAAIARQAAIEHPWITVLSRPQGAGRRVGPGVVEAFYAGLEHAGGLDGFDYVCKLDGDLELAPGYFAELVRRFESNPRLGTASGKSHLLIDGNLVRERTSDDISHGMSKFYRRECFEQIGGFVREVMWDGIDCHRCRMFGWEAASYGDPELRIVHLRQMGSSYKSVFHGRLRWGRGQYFMGTHPLYLMGITAYRLFERPWVLGGLCILAGYGGAWLRRVPRYEDAHFRRHLHRWQLRELAERCRLARPSSPQGEGNGTQLGRLEGDAGRLTHAREADRGRGAETGRSAISMASQE
jgi:glycosyltransferase involved in cell wall biosynthesis